MSILNGLGGAALGGLFGFGIGLGYDKTRNMTLDELSSIQAKMIRNATAEDLARRYASTRPFSPQPAHTGPELDLTPDSVEVRDVPLLAAPE